MILLPLFQALAARSRRRGLRSLWRSSAVLSRVSLDYFPHVTDKPSERSSMGLVQGNRLAHDDHNFSGSDAPIPLGQNGPAPLNGHRNDRGAGFYRDYKAASFEGQEFPPRAARSFREKNHREPSFENLAGLPQTGHCLRPVRSIYNDVSRRPQDRKSVV